MQLFRESYETLKKADPEAMVYPTDTGAALKESPYAFREFGRDMFELGYLRWPTSCPTQLRLKGLRPP